MGGGAIRRILGNEVFQSEGVFFSDLEEGRTTRKLARGVNDTRCKHEVPAYSAPEFDATRTWVFTIVTVSVRQRSKCGDVLTT